MDQAVAPPDSEAPGSDAGGSEAGGGGCHGGRERMQAAAREAGGGALMAQLMRDYPRGPHEQPQSMCPAFGSLRIGLRMRRVATVLCGSACCVYGLSFTARFYGARRTVGYVPFNSETLVRGTLFEDIRDAVVGLADKALHDAVVVINLCVPTASGVPLDRLPREIDGVRVIGIDVPGFGVPTHAEAKDVLTGAMLARARSEIEQGPVQRPREAGDGRAAVALVGEMFPADSAGLGAMLEPMGLGVAPPLPAREWRDLYGALDACVVAAVHPFYTASLREFDRAGRPVVGSAPVGLSGTEHWLEAVGRAAGAGAAQIGAARDRALPAIRAALEGARLSARISLSGYEGSELLVARLLCEAGATIPYVGTACPRTPWSEEDRDWLERHGTHVQFRAALEQDLAAMREIRPDFVIGTTPVVQKAKEGGTPGIYFTNMVSSRPLLGAAGAAALPAIVAAQTRGAERYGRMVSFFGSAG